MAYTQFDPTTPDPSVDDITDFGSNTRTNLAALRDALATGNLSGWSVTLEPVAEPTSAIYSNGGTLRIKQTITYGTSGATDKKITNVVLEYSSNSGVSYDAVDSTSITYDAEGNYTSAPGMGITLLPFLQNLLHLLKTHEDLTAPHGAVSTATASALCVRDANARLQAANPAVSADVATKGWVEGSATAANATKVGGRTIYSSTSAPSGGVDGDIWLQHES